MTKEQKRKVIAVIKKDANFRFAYCSQIEGKTCVIGGLLKAIGWTDPQLRELAATSISSIYYPETIPARKALEKEYGLSLDQARELQVINDNEPDLAPRRQKLVARVKEWLQST